MTVLLGAMAVWLLMSIALGVTIFLMTLKGMIWPFAVVFILLFLLVKKFGCTSH